MLMTIADRMLLVGKSLDQVLLVLPMKGFKNI